MTRRKQFQPKRLTTGDDEDDEDKDKTADDSKLAADNTKLATGNTKLATDGIKFAADDTKLAADDIMQIDTKPEQTGPDLKGCDLDLVGQKTDIIETENVEMNDHIDGEEAKENVKSENENEEHESVKSKGYFKKEMTSEDSGDENLCPKLDNNKLTEGNSDITSDKNMKSVKVKKELNDADIERELKRELREAVEIRIPKVRSKKEISDYSWVSSGSGHKSEKGSKRPETPPLQKLMRHEFSPLKTDNSSMHSPPKRFKDNSHSSRKEGFTSKLASVIIPSSNNSVLPKTASHPKQLLSHSIANIRSSSFSKLPFSTSSLLSRSFPVSQPVFKNNSSSSSDNDQPLDLSKKPSNSTNESSRDSRSLSKSSTSKSDSYKHENGMSSTSLQSLQQKFGGDFHLRGLRKPLNYMLYGPEIPALHQALLHSASMALPHFPHPLSNGLPKYTPEKPRHRNSTPSPSHKNTCEESLKPVKKEDQHVISEKSMKREQVEKSDIENEPKDDVDKQGENYTNQLCTCGKWFDGLYSLSLHLQETGHLPARGKSVNLMEYPKLVRGQDMWLNQESEQTRRILRCIQCGESFKTLPLLTVHMMKTQHYTKIVSSEHARRVHKCSAYCDKEQDKDCVFKCKVCHDTFPDMEGLANHMIMSGHHKKQSPRTSQGALSDLQFKKRKRYSFEEALHPFGNPSMAAMLDYKRHSLGGQASPELSLDDLDDSRITCENCGNKIETKIFVEHVRACLGQRLREDVARLEKEKENLEKLEKERKRAFSLMKEESEKNWPNSPVKKRKVENDEDEVMDEEKEVDKGKEVTKVKVERNEDIDTESSQNGEKSSHDKKSDTGSNDSKFNSHIDPTESVQSRSSDSESELEAGEITNKSKNILKEIQTLVDSKSSILQVKHEVDKDNDNSNIEAKKCKTSLAKQLDIIDPNNVKDEDSSEGSALSAMESFIKKSFSNKFDYKKGNIIISPHTSADATVHTGPLTSSSLGFESSDYLHRYKNFYAALNLNNGYKQEYTGKDKTRGDRNNHDHVKNGIKSKLEKDKERRSRSAAVRTNSDDEKEDGRSSVKSGISDNSSTLDKTENLETKYLNMEDVDNAKVDKDAKSSALDNLSSFVYGQTLTSEHPLDSLQKLITKSDIPKLMAGQAAGHFKYLPPHLQMHQSSMDLTVPLNLSVKSPKAESDEDQDDSRSRQDDDSLSDYEVLNSPANSDGEPVEYRCAACSRRFASKGSYRYHLSRCHLSSVKRYGIKEAFNMSPYVYLPLDHTAKFSKYYEMAKELANKAKENRAKSN